MHGKKRYTKIILLAISSLILLGLIYGTVKANASSCMGVSLISEGELQNIIDMPEEIGNIISVKDHLLPYDEENNRLYIPCVADETTRYCDLQGKMESVLPEYQLYFLEDSIFDILSEAVKYSYEFQLYAVNSSGSYQKYQVVFTTLPMMEMHGEVTGIDDRNREIYSGKITVWEPQKDTGVVRVQDSIVEWHDRGYSSMSFQKKSQKISLKKENGENNHLSLIGLSKDDDYILNPMWFDDIKVREKLAMELWNEIAEENNSSLKMSEGEYCELVVNGEYQGLRLLQNRIERSYLKLDEDDILLKGKNVNVGSGNCPEDVYEIIYAADTDAAYEIMRDFFYETDFSMLNLENWIDVQLFLQLGNMVDNHYYKNIYYVIERDAQETISLIPWDTDMSFGIYWEDGFRYLPESVNEISYRMEYSSLKEQYPQLQDEMRIRWQELRKSIFSEEHLIEKIEAYEDILYTSGALKRDYKVLGWNSWGGEDTIENLKGYIERRLEILDENYMLQ